MAYAKATLADLKQSIADKHDSGTLPTDSATLTYWTRLLNEAQEYCAQNLRIETSTSLTTSSNSVSLPDDFMFPNRVYDDDGNEYTQISQVESPKATGKYYWITGNHFDGFTFNIDDSLDDDTFTIYYTFRPSPMSSDSDECIIPDPEAVVLRAYGKLRLAETDPLEDAQISLRESEFRLKNLKSDMTLNDQQLGFTSQAGA